MKKIPALFAALFITLLTNAQPKPKIDQVYPLNGPIGTMVTILGSGFSPSTDTTMVFMGPVRATITSVRDSVIQVNVPFGATYQPITVTSNYMSVVSKDFFTVTFPGSNGKFLPGSFSPKIDLKPGTFPHSVQLGDFNGDGKPDLLVSKGGTARSTIIVNTSTTGNLSFNRNTSTATTGTSNEGTAIADFDGDGKLDVVIANASPGNIGVYSNYGTAGMDTAALFLRAILNAGSGTFCVAAGDLDNDGRPDIVAAENGRAQIKVFKNHSTSRYWVFDTINIPTGPNPYGIAIHDIDGDGKQDLIISTQSFGSALSVLKNISKGDTILFDAPYSVATLAGPFTLSIGDFDSDGKPDLAATSSSNNSITVVRNNCTPGNFSFDAQQDISTGNYPVCVALGDLDGDGKVDMVTADRFGNTVSVIRNTSSAGNIIFAPVISYAVGEAPVYVTLGDMDGDSKPDIAVANSSDSTVSILKNIHGLNLVPVIQSFSPTSGFGGTVITIKGVGFNNSNKVSFGGQAASAFTVLSDSIINATISTGKTGDVFVSTSYGETSKPGFIFTGPQISSFIPISGVAGTIITITGNYFSQVTDVQFGGSPAQSFTVLSPTTIKAVVGNGGTGKVTVMTATDTAELSGFSFGRPGISSFGPRSGPVGTRVMIHGYNFSPFNDSNIVHFGAVRGIVISSNKDTIIAEVPKGATYHPITVTTNRLTAFSDKPFVTSFPNDSLRITRETFSLSGNYNVGGFPRAVEIDDFNGDGRPDLVTVNANTNNISVLANTSQAGSLSFAVSQAYATGPEPYKAAIADFNGDGKKDIVVTNFNSGSSGSISIYKNTSSISLISFTVLPVIPSGNGPIGVATGDFNQDGRTDIAVASGNSVNFSVFINSTLPGGEISFAPKQNFPTGGSTSHIVAADIDNDNKTDLVVTNFSDKLLLVYRNISVNGTLQFASAVGFSTELQPTSLAAGDVNGDDRTDIIVNNYGAGRATVWLNATNGSFPSLVPKQSFALNSTAFALGDLNGDAKPELISGRYVDGKISVFENGIGSAMTFPYRDSIQFVAGNFDSYVSTGDLDGDGKADIAMVYAGSDFVKILRNRKVTPYIGEVTPAMVTEGATVKIYGARLSAITQVLFGGTPAKSFTIISPNEISAVVGSGSSGSVIVSGDDGTANYNYLRFIPSIIAEDSIQFCSGGSVTLTSTDNLNNQWYRNNALIPGATSKSYTVTAWGDYSLRTTADTIIIKSLNTIPVRIYGVEKPAISLDTSRQLSYYGGVGGQWFLNGTAIPDATSSTFKPTVDGLYTFKSVNHGCESAISDPFTFRIFNMIELGNDQHINMYPNPTTADMRIVWQITGNPPMNIEITDSQGRPVIIKQSLSSGSTFSLWELKKGIYYIRIYNLSLKISNTTTIMKQ